LGPAPITIATAAQNWNIVSNTLSLEGNLVTGNNAITNWQGHVGHSRRGNCRVISILVNEGELDAAEMQVLPSETAAMAVPLLSNPTRWLNYARPRWQPDYKRKHQWRL